MNTRPMHTYEPLTIDNKELKPCTIVPDYPGYPNHEPNPNLNEICESTARELYRHYISLPNHQLDIPQKYMAFKMLGFSDQEVAELCKPKELDREAIMKEVAEHMVKERKLLERENRRNLRSI